MVRMFCNAFEGGPPHRMLSEDDISRHCHARTLQRARSIAASDRNILTKQVRYNPPETTLSAFVASSSGWNDRYRTSVTFDEDEGDLVDYACTCPAYREYDGMCKHCAALALTYLDAPEKFMGYRAHRAPTTSSCLLELMERSKAADEAEEQGGIDLEATVVYGYQSWSARFKVVGSQGSYVMKSISDFVDRMRRGERFSYGKKLAFTHVPAMLAESARPIARFLDRAVALREQATGSAFWRYRGRDEIGRDLDLSDYELIELLDLLDGRPFTVEGTDCGTRSLTRAHVVSADPDVEVSVRRTDDGGYAIEADELAFVAQGDRMYLWQGETFFRCSADFARTAGFLRTVCDADFPYAITQLVDEADARGKYTPQKIEEMEYSCSCFILYLGLDKRYPSDAVHSIRFASDFERNIDDIFDDARFPDDPSFYCYAPSSLDRSLAPEGCSTLYVLVPVPPLSPASPRWSDAEVAEYRDRVLDLMERETVYEDVRDHIVFERAYTPLDFAERFNAYDGATFGLRPTLGQSNYWRPHNKATDCSRLYFCGSSVHPGAGVPIVLLSAKLAAEELMRDDRL